VTSRCVVLLGSPKAVQGSASARLAGVVTARLEQTGWSVRWFHLREAASDASLRPAVHAAVADADLVVLAAPLYVDSLPAPTIDLLTEIAGRRKDRETAPRTGFCALLNCGFVEAFHNDTAQRICRRFCEQAGLSWRGGLSVGSAGAMTGRIARLLGTAGDALARGEAIPQAVERGLRKPTLPRVIYIAGGNLMWRRMARRFGITDRAIRARPFAEGSSSE
jgi:hypothetical protein